ncbi:hypothetical protein LCGC14_1127230 [marine sediment metagenome]|uniref:Lipoprotein n=1 Tax=marine sediment metagenome TaxID=412755 RepID=A0A0F9M6Z8_9ZZZZ
MKVLTILLIVLLFVGGCAFVEWTGEVTENTSKSLKNAARASRVAKAKQLLQEERYRLWLEENEALNAKKNPNNNEN